MAKLSSPSFTLKDIYDSDEFYWQEDFNYDEFPNKAYDNINLGNVNPVIMESFDFDTLNCEVIDRQLILKPPYGTTIPKKTKFTFEPDSVIGYIQPESFCYDSDNDCWYFGGKNGYIMKWASNDKTPYFLCGGPYSTGYDVQSIAKDQNTDTIWATDYESGGGQYYVYRLIETKHWSQRLTQVANALYYNYQVINDQLGNVWLFVRRKSDNHIGVMRVYDDSTFGAFNDLGTLTTANHMQRYGARVFWIGASYYLHYFDFPPSGETVSNITNYTVNMCGDFGNSPIYGLMSDGHIYHFEPFQIANAGMYRLNLTTGISTKVASMTAETQRAGGKYDGDMVMNADRTRMRIAFCNQPGIATYSTQVYDYVGGVITKLYDVDDEYSAEYPTGIVFEYMNNLFFATNDELWEFGGLKQNTFLNGGTAMARKSTPKPLLDNFWDESHSFKVRFQTTTGDNEYQLWLGVGALNYATGVGDSSKHIGFKLLYDPTASVGGCICGTVGNGTTEQWLRLKDNYYLTPDTDYVLSYEYLPTKNRVSFSVNGEELGTIEGFHPTGTPSGEDEYIFNSYLQAWGNMPEVCLKQVKFYKPTY